MKYILVWILIFAGLERLQAQEMSRLSIQASSTHVVFVRFPDKSLRIERDTVLTVPTGAYPVGVWVRCGGTLVENEAIITFDYTIRLVENEEAVLQAHRFSRFELASLPFGAEVRSGWKYLGTTPMTLIRELQSLPVSVQKKGFIPAEATLSPCKTTTLNLQKKPIDSQKISLLQKIPTKEYRWLSVLGGTATIAGLVYSIQNKFKADDLYDLYKVSGDPALRPQIKALDTKAGWGLAIAQTGLAVVAIRLVLK
ncbi:MAG: hypothetical protein JNN12_07550 [Bacteroidetes Order II. Incertae sedis bacterium]|nr:hypothetical protein [Bacteroidetes Order II. bacterium]